MAESRTVVVELKLHEWRKHRRTRLRLSPENVLARLEERGVSVSRQTLWRAETGGYVSAKVLEALDTVLQDDAEVTR